MKKVVFVKKFDGTTEKYNSSKIKRSLANAGADGGTINRVLASVDKILYNGITTKELFRFVFREFKKSQPHDAPKYDLRNAILRLGYEGYVFEKFIAKLFNAQGYTCKMNRIVQGKFVKHEIDVTAEKGKEILMVEAKYHNKHWIRTGIKDALYVYARFLDVKQEFTKPMLVTNTKFSYQAKDYARGVGMKLMGWKCPEENSLEQNIERYNLYPVTMVGISINQAQRLFANKILLLSELVKKDPRWLARLFHIPQQKADRILETARALCNGK